MPIADESNKIARARKKLELKIDLIERDVTPSNLRKTVKKMASLIDKNASSRLDLKEINIHLANENDAPLSPFIQDVRNTLVKEMNTYARGDINHKTHNITASSKDAQPESLYSFFPSNLSKKN